MWRYRKNNPLMNFDTASEKIVNATAEVAKPQIPMAISYARVSSDGQKIDGQEESCRGWCEANEDIKIIKTFKDEGISWTVLDRKGLMDAIAFLEKENKKYTKITHFVCTEFSRIARPDEVIQGTQIVSRIEATWVKIITTLEHRDTSTDEGRLMDDIKFSIARYERKKTMKRAKNGMVSLALNGGWPFWRVPPWYMKVGEGKDKTIEVDETKANIISKWLELFANNVLVSNSDLLGYFKWEGLTTNSKFYTGKLWLSFIEKTFDLHRLFFYAWYVVYPDRWINEPIKGKRQGIISLELVYDLINKLQKWGVKKNTRNTNASSEFPLRGMITCPSCTRFLTSWYSTGKAGNRFPYYWCSNKFCPQRENIPKNFLEEDFERLVKSYEVPAPCITMFDTMLRRDWQDLKDLDELQKDERRWEKKRIENRLKNIEEMMLKTRIADLYAKLELEWTQLNGEKKVLEESLNDKFFADNELFALSSKLKGMLVNPIAFWKIGSNEIRQLLIGVRFGWSLKFSKKENYRTLGNSSLLQYFHDFYAGVETCYYPERDLNPHDR
jgi:site-specific DNA recombinase